MVYISALELSKSKAFYNSMVEQGREQIFHCNGDEFRFVVIDTKEFPADVPKVAFTAMTYVRWNTIDFIMDPIKTLNEAEAWCFVFGDQVPEEYLELVLYHEYTERTNGGDHVYAFQQEITKAEEKGEEFLKQYTAWLINLHKQFIFEDNESLVFYRNLLPEVSKKVLDDIIKQG